MTDKAKAAIATLENLGYTHEGGILWKPPLGKAPDFNLLDTLHARIASLEAQLSARQAAPDGWRLVPVASTAAMEWAFRSAEVRYSNGAGRMLPMDPHSAFKAQYREMLSAAPPPPEREPLTDEQIAGLDNFVRGTVFGRFARAKAFARGIERRHGIGGTK